jgi:adenylate cyclase, class 2
MIEVEIRAKLINIDKTKERVKEIGASLIRQEIQEDIIFGHENFLDSKKMMIEGGIIARIRKIDNETSLEFKEIIRKGCGLDVSCKINKKENGKHLLNKLGFNEAFCVSKTREIFSYKDFLICFDEVDGLGDFIEIEKTVENASEKEGARNDCISLLKSIDDELIIENKKYGDLIQEKKNESNKPNT